MSNRIFLEQPSVATVEIGLHDNDRYVFIHAMFSYNTIYIERDKVNCLIEILQKVAYEDEVNPH